MVPTSAYVVRIPSTSDPLNIDDSRFESRLGPKGTRYPSAVMEHESLIALKRCEVPNETVANRLKLSPDFIIEQELVQIDAASKFKGGAFGKVIRASYGGAAVRVKRFHAILCSEGGPRLDLHRFFQECRLKLLRLCVTQISFTFMA